MAAGDIFLGLRSFIKGKITPRELMDLDPLISNVKVNKNNLAQSEIEISFDNTQDFLENFGFSDDDAWFYSKVSSNYSDYEFHSSESVEDDLIQGYSLYFFNDENKNLMKKISNLISNEEVELDDEESVGDFFKTLREIFTSEFDSITIDLATERNHSLNGSARNSIEKDLQNWAESNDYKINSYETGIKVSIADLLEKYIRYNLPHEDLQKLFQVISDEKHESYNWSEDVYDYEDDDYFDYESFNRNVEYQLEKIYSKIEESAENSKSNFKEFLDTVRRIKSKFKLHHPYPLPKQKSVKFKIMGFDRQKNKINVKLVSNNMKPREILVSEENFYNLLYQPTLFDLDDM
jgi:hypothetical protein